MPSCTDGKRTFREPKRRPCGDPLYRLSSNIPLGGELVLMVEGETKLSPGDVVIQRNTNHVWRNDTRSSVYSVAVLVSIKRPVSVAIVRRQHTNTHKRLR